MKTMNFTAITSAAPSLFIGALRLARAFNAAQKKLIDASMSTRTFSKRHDALLDACTAARSALLARFPKAPSVGYLRSNNLA